MDGLQEKLKNRIKMKRALRTRSVASRKTKSTIGFLCWPFIPEESSGSYLENHLGFDILDDLGFMTFVRLCLPHGHFEFLYEIYSLLVAT